jgi:exopolyphosphatase / guanosine-5'-triphosphate,3'-diphosphate pyrophosphatase
MEQYFAVLDIGTNSFHLLIARANKDGSFEPVVKEREILRIGVKTDENDSSHIITDDDIEKVVAIITRYQQLCAPYKCTLKAVATSAVREARNNEDFRQKIKERTGVIIEIIDGQTEARLIYKGIDNSLKIKDKKIICIDIGGGSTEITIGENGNVLFSDSLKLGAVRLSSQFFPEFELTEKSISECRKYIRLLFNSIKTKVDNIGFDISVASSGSAHSAYSLISSAAGFPLTEIPDNVKFSKKEFCSVMEVVLSKRKCSERLTIPGIDPKRADILPAGFLILDEFFNLFDIKEAIVSIAALKEGVIAEQIILLRN